MNPLLLKLLRYLQPADLLLCYLQKMSCLAFTYTQACTPVSLLEGNQSKTFCNTEGNEKLCIETVRVCIDIHEREACRASGRKMPHEALDLMGTDEYFPLASLAKLMSQT